MRRVVAENERYSIGDVCTLVWCFTLMGKFTDDLRHALKERFKDLGVHSLEFKNMVCLAQVCVQSFGTVDYMSILENFLHCLSNTSFMVVQGNKSMFVCVKLSCTYESSELYLVSMIGKPRNIFWMELGHC